MTGNGMPPQDTGSKSLGEIVAEVAEKASQLVREEIELAKAEVKDKISKLTRGAAAGAAAGVFLNDVFNWEADIWPGYLMVTLALFLFAILAAVLALRLFKKGAPPTPDLAIEEAKRTRAELEAQKIERDQVHRSLERGEEVKT